MQSGGPRDAASGRTQAVYYRDRHGVEPVDVFIEALCEVNPIAAAKIDDWVERYLNGRPVSEPPPEHPITSQVEGELRELRVRFARTRYRLLYRRSQSLIVLLHIFEKHSGAIPERDIRVARQRFDDFTERMQAIPRRRPRAAGRDAPPRRRGTS